MPSLGTENAIFVAVRFWVPQAPGTMLFWVSPKPIAATNPVEGSALATVVRITGVVPDENGIIAPSFAGPGLPLGPLKPLGPLSPFGPGMQQH